MSSLGRRSLTLMFSAAKVAFMARYYRRECRLPGAQESSRRAELELDLESLMHALCHGNDTTPS